MMIEMMLLEFDEDEEYVRAIITSFSMRCMIPMLTHVI